MTSNTVKLLEQLKSRRYRSLRINREMNITEKIQGKNSMMREALLFSTMLEEETPAFIDGDSIGFYRSIMDYPFYYDENGNRSHEWLLGNITPNYARIMEMGFDSVLVDIYEKQKSGTPKQKEFYDAAAFSIEAVLQYCAHYAKAAKEQNPKLYEALKHIPHHGARSFYEACVFMKLIIFSLRCARNSHITLGRFDKYMYPYFIKDCVSGASKEQLFETLEDFFISINFDVDLYQGIQQGDNGQSMMLGGRNADGSYEFNELSALCMNASMELNLIDPKINLRVCKDTPFELYLLGTKLTQKGLGFPQYSNDDVVIPGLVQLGYDYEDAINYTVAACWEFIIPSCGMDIPNIETMNFPKAVNEVILHKLQDCSTFEQLMEEVNTEIGKECNQLIAQVNQGVLAPSPYMSVFMDGCIEKGMDLSENGAKYNNSGLHGAGIANAADALAAVKNLIYDEKSLDKQTLLQTLQNNFEGSEELRHRLLSCPKMGNNDNYVDGIACSLMDFFCKSLQGKKTTGVVSSDLVQAAQWNTSGVRGRWAQQQTDAKPMNRTVRAFRPQLRRHSTDLCRLFSPLPNMI